MFSSDFFYFCKYVSQKPAAGIYPVVGQEVFLLMPVHNTNLSKETILDEVFGLWPSLSESQRALVSRHLRIGRYKKNAPIYHSSDSPDHVYILVSGKAKVLKDGVGGRNQIIRVIKPVEMFGYRAHFAGESHRTFATAFESSVVAMLPIGVVEQLMRENHEVSLCIVRHLSVLLGQSDDRTVNLTQKHIRGRLAEALLFLKDNYGLEEDGSTLSIYLSREDLANLSNMTTSNAIRTLSAFAAERLIAIDGKKIKIVDQDELCRVSKMG